MSAAADEESQTDPIRLLRGPVTEITIITPVEKGEVPVTATWTLSTALLLHHSGYFRRACRPDTFREGKERKVTLTDFEPAIFDLFVEFMLYGKYTSHDDLSDQTKVRDSAKA
ncbi:hypothetical protein NX059_006266 [Plenodomus lindquistii]|nr:hypothetical protein NX059_006266 [Plenodomus lindquistii]